MRRYNLEKELRARTDELEAVLHSAMDAILILDERGNIARANRAAETIFGATNLTGRHVETLLTEQGIEKLRPLFDEWVQATRKGTRQLWIAGGLEAHTTAGETFVAEGTLSGFRLGGLLYLTLILRNVEERLAAESQIAALNEQAAYLKEEIEHHFGEIVGKSPAIRRMVREIGEVAQTGASVLVTGETGTGKELVARAIHQASRRAD